MNLTDDEWNYIVEVVGETQQLLNLENGNLLDPCVRCKISNKLQNIKELEDPFNDDLTVILDDLYIPEIEKEIFYDFYRRFKTLDELKVIYFHSKFCHKSKILRSIENTRNIIRNKLRIPDLTTTSKYHLENFIKKKLNKSL